MIGFRYFYPHRVLVGQSPAVDDLEGKVYLLADELLGRVNKLVVLLCVLAPLGVARSNLDLKGGRRLKATL